MSSRTFALLMLLPAFALLSCSRSQPPPRGGASLKVEAASSSETAAKPAVAALTTTKPAPGGSQTSVLMHNVILNERPGLKLRVRWLRGQMQPTSTDVIPSFDEPSSFVVEVQAGVIATSLSDISGILNGGLLEGTPLRNVTLSAQGTQLRLNGTLHKGVPMPIELIGDLSVSADGLICLHATKLHVLKLPVKGLLKSLHIQVGDLVSTKGATGVQVSGDNILLDPRQILPAPAIRGRLTDVHLGSKTGDLITVFGDARPEVMSVREWRNFIQLRGGTVNFGKLIMRQADLVLIDASDDAWFNFDLTRYQEQLVNGRIQMTPQAGLRVFMPDIDKIPPSAANRAISLQWMKNRNIPPPTEVTR